MKKSAYSKKLAFFSAFCFITAIIYGIVVFAYGVLTETAYDFTLPITLIGVTGAAFGVTMASYANKSRYENVIKLQIGFVKTKYRILKEMGALDYSRAVQEIEEEFMDAETDFDNEKSMANQEITYHE